MPFKRTKTNYRKIYEDYYGPIPKDQDGRTFDIHHLDGDDENNDPTNLVALSIHEHYELHYSQKDWAAARLIALRMELDTVTISELTRRNNLAQVEAGTHPWQKRADGTSLQKERAADPNYINPFSKREDGTSVQTDRVTSGTHHLQGGDIQRRTNRRLLDEGSHQFQQESLQQTLKKNRIERLENGTHSFSPSNNPVHKQLANGTHSTQTKLCCVYCREETDLMNFAQSHGVNCPSLNPMNAFIGRASCLGCREVLDHGNYFKLHGPKCPAFDPEKRIVIGGKIYGYVGQVARDLGITVRQAKRLVTQEKENLINTG